MDLEIQVGGLAKITAGSWASMSCSHPPLLLSKNSNRTWSNAGIAARQGRRDALSQAATFLPLQQGWDH